MNEEQTPEEMFDATGWWRHAQAGRWELYVNGELCAVIPFEEVRLMTKIGNTEALQVLIDQAADRFQC